MARLDTKTIWLVTAAAAAVIVALQFCPATRGVQTYALEGASGSALAIRVFDSPERRLFALAGLDRFPPGYGLLLVFDDGTPPRIWSKTLQVEADLLWLDETKQIVDRDLGAQPCRNDPCVEYTPGRGAVSVLVLPPGTGQDPAFQAGQTAVLKPVRAS